MQIKRFNDADIKFLERANKGELNNILTHFKAAMKKALEGDFQNYEGVCIEAIAFNIKVITEYRGRL